MPYIYESHISGNLYETDEERSYEDLSCETCGDCDSWIGYYETKKERKMLLKLYHDGLL